MVIIPRTIVTSMLCDSWRCFDNALQWTEENSHEGHSNLPLSRVTLWCCETWLARLFEFLNVFVQVGSVQCRYPLSVLWSCFWIFATMYVWCECVFELLTECSESSHSKGTGATLIELCKSTAKQSEMQMTFLPQLGCLGEKQPLRALATGLCFALPKLRGAASPLPRCMWDCARAAGSIFPPFWTPSMYAF